MSKSWLKWPSPQLLHLLLLLLMLLKGVVALAVAVAFDLAFAVAATNTFQIFDVYIYRYVYIFTYVYIYIYWHLLFCIMFQRNTADAPWRNSSYYLVGCSYFFTVICYACVSLWALFVIAAKLHWAYCLKCNKHLMPSCVYRSNWCLTVNQCCLNIWAKQQHMLFLPYIAQFLLEVFGW